MIYPRYQFADLSFCLQDRSLLRSVPGEIQQRETLDDSRKVTLPAPQAEFLAALLSEAEANLSDPSYLSKSELQLAIQGKPSFGSIEQMKSKVCKAIGELGVDPKVVIESRRNVGYRLGVPVTKLEAAGDQLQLASVADYGGLEDVPGHSIGWVSLMKLLLAVLALGIPAFTAAEEVHGRISNHEKAQVRMSKASSPESHEEAGGYVKYWAVSHEGRGRWEDARDWRHLQRELVDPHPSSRGKPNLLKWPFAALNSDVLILIALLSSGAAGALIGQFLRTLRLDWRGFAMGAASGVCASFVLSLCGMAIGFDWTAGVSSYIPPVVTLGSSLVGLSLELLLGDRIGGKFSLGEVVIAPQADC